MERYGVKEGWLDERLLESRNLFAFHLFCYFCLSPSVSHPRYCSSLYFHFAPTKPFLQQSKGSFLDHKLNVTLLLKICHRLNALGLTPEFPPHSVQGNLLQDVSSSCLSHSSRLALSHPGTGGVFSKSLASLDCCH